MDGGQQRPPDMGAHGEAEDLGLVRVPAQGRSALAAADSLHVAGGGADRQVAHAAEHDHLDLHGDEPSAVRSGDCAGREPGHDHAAAGEHRGHPDFRTGRSRRHQCRSSPIDPRGSTNYDDHLPSQTYKGFDELRHRQPQPEGRDADAARAVSRGTTAMHAQGDRYYLTSWLFAVLRQRSSPRSPAGRAG